MNETPVDTTITPATKPTLRETIAQALGGDVYTCSRVWSAWGVGTMDQDDFHPAQEDEDVLDNLESAITAFVVQHQPVTDKKLLPTLFDMMTPGNTDDDRVRRIRELFVPVQGMEPTDQDIINSIIFTGSVDTQSAYWIRQLFTAAHAAEMARKDAEIERWRETFVHAEQVGIRLDGELTDIRESLAIFHKATAELTVQRNEARAEITALKSSLAKETAKLVTVLDVCRELGWNGVENSKCADTFLRCFFADAQEELKGCKEKLATAERERDKFKSLYVAEWTDNENALIAAGIDMTVTEDGGKPVNTGIEELAKQRNDNQELYHNAMNEVRQLREASNTLRQRVAELERAISDPAAVLVNMMRGTIAVPQRFVHLMGEEG